MKVLVTGGAGYIGSHTAQQLATRGSHVVIYDDLSTGHSSLANGHELVVGDLLDSRKLRSALCGVDAVMHFAASAYVGESVANPRKYFENNVGPMVSLINATVDAGIRSFIFSSSCAVYGIPVIIPISEDSPRDPVNPYGASKLFCEHALEAYYRAYGLNFISLRYFNAAGAAVNGEIGELHVPESHIIPSALEVVAGLRPEFEVYGTDYPTPDGTCIRDYVHVEDIADAHVRALEFLLNGGESTAINLGSGKGHSVKDVISTVEEVTGRQVKTSSRQRRPGDPPTLVASHSKAQELLGWGPSLELNDMIASAWAWLLKTRTRAAAGQLLSTLATD
ncbi:MAG: UDP-glucose 4-epimerase GalE [Acidobacteria bacterium]|nr:UDP-glucose 4-epimerase GalE [Acidobacteriota bacterium]